MIATPDNFLGLSKAFDTANDSTLSIQCVLWEINVTAGSLEEKGIIKSKSDRKSSHFRFSSGDKNLMPE